MTTRRQFLGSIPAAGAAFAVGSGPAALTASTFDRAEETAAPGPLWRSPSLVEETVTGPNGAITSRDISEVNDRLAMMGECRRDRSETDRHAARPRRRRGQEETWQLIHDGLEVRRVVGSIADV